MKTLILILVLLLALPDAQAKDTSSKDDAIPVIKLDNVPLFDAIRNLARQMQQNYIFDPKVTKAWAAPRGDLGPEPSVTVLWKNLTVKEALARLLTEHRLMMVTNPETTIARIAFTNQTIKPIPAG